MELTRQGICILLKWFVVVLCVRYILLCTHANSLSRKDWAQKGKGE